MQIGRCIWVLSVLLVCVSLRAEEIQLKDGTKINGTLTGVSGDTFQVKTAYGNIQVPRAQVVAINFPENQPKKEDGDAGKTAKPVQDESLIGTTYTNRSERFQVKVPEGWVLAPEIQSKEIVTALKSSDQTDIFAVTVEKFSGTLSTYKVLAETQYQMQFKDYEKISESEIQMDGKTGVRLLWHGKNSAANNTPVKFLIYIVPYEHQMVRLSFWTLEPLFDDGLPRFEKIAASYQSIDPADK